MGTVTDKLNALLNTKAAIKSAIIAKGQTVADADPFSSYPAKIQAIQTGVQLPALTNPGTAADLLAGKQLIDQDGNPLTGTMPEVEQATPTISVSDGLITASATQAAGYVAAGTKSATLQLPAAEPTITILHGNSANGFTYALTSSSITVAYQSSFPGEIIGFVLIFPPLSAKYDDDYSYNNLTVISYDSVSGKYASTRYKSDGNGTPNIIASHWEVDAGNYVVIGTDQISIDCTGIGISGIAGGASQGDVEFFVYCKS